MAPWEVVLAFLGAFWSRLFEFVCFFRHLVDGFLPCVKKQTISSLNDFSIVFESPSSVTHCKEGVCMEEGGHVCISLGIMGWANGCHTMTPCVCWGVEPAGFVSGQGYLAAGAPVCSGRSPLICCVMFSGVKLSIRSFVLLLLLS